LTKKPSQGYNLHKERASHNDGQPLLFWLKKIFFGLVSGANADGHDTL
jgi:hypothetical protein